MHLRPISDQEAASETQKIYHDIRQLFGLNSTPEYFSYLANFPPLLELVWQQLRPICADPRFPILTGKILAACRSRLQNVYPPDPKLAILMGKLVNDERVYWIKEFGQLQKANVTLLTISILVRETIKGMDLTKIVGGRLLLKEPARETSAYDQTLASDRGFGPQSLISQFSQDAYFLTYLRLISEFVRQWSKTADYLSARVALENLIQDEIRQLPQSFKLNYTQVVSLLLNQPFADELVYLLQDALPSYFPKQLLSSVLLEICLQPPKSLGTIPPPNKMLLIYPPNSGLQV